MTDPTGHPYETAVSEGGSKQFARGVLRQLLHACVDFALHESTALTQRVSEDIFHAAERSLRTDEQQLLWTSFQGLNKRQRDFNKILQRQLPALLQKAFDSDSIAALNDVEVSGGKLKLVEAEDVEREVLISNNIRLLEDLCSETLAAMTIRICQLKGHSVPSIYYNPFRPEAFVRGFVAAWEEFDGNRLSTRAVLRALRMSNFVPLNALYTELNDLMVGHGITIDSRQMIKRESSTPGSRGGGGGGGGGGDNNNNNNQQALWNRSPNDGDPNAMAQAMAAGAHMLAGGGMPMGMVASGLGNVPAGWQFNPAKFMQQLGVLLEQFGQLSPGGGVIARADVLAGGAMPMVAAPDAALLRRLDALQLQPWRGKMVPIDTGADAAGVEGYGDDDDEVEGGRRMVVVGGGVPGGREGSAMPIPGALVLQEIGAGMEAQGASEIDRATIEMLARIFDFVLQDRALPSEMKAMIAQLQVPVLKAALIDREFFLREEHPARRLVDMMARAAVHWTRESGPEDPLYLAFESAVDRAHEFQDDLSLFDSIVADFQAVLDTQEERNDEAVADKIERAAHDEARGFALQEVDKRIERRFELADIDATLARFLKEQWRQVLVIRCMERDAEPTLWSQSLEAMDVLIWSVLPKINSIERGELLKSLPGLLRHINDSLKLVEWDGPDRDHFMKYLMDSHAAVVRAPVPQVVAGSVPVANPRLAQDSTVDEVAAKPMSNVTQFGLDRGDWFVLELGDNALRYRLSWVSPMRTKYIFTSREGERAIVKNDVELSDMLKSGALRKLDTSPVVQRAIAATLLAPSQMHPPGAPRPTSTSAQASASASEMRLS